MVRPSKRKIGSDTARCTSREIVIFLAGIVVGIIGLSIFNNGGGDYSYMSYCVTSQSSSLLGPSSSSSSTTNNTSLPVDTTTATQLLTSAIHSAADNNNIILPTGFHPIYSYYGKFNHITDYIPTKWWLESSPNHKNQANGGEWFAQHGQDVAVAKFFNFKRNGYFVDLAANDAVWASNTFGLEQNFGWTGICIEPNPIYWYRLSFRNCHVVGSIVGGETNVEVDVVLGQATHNGPYGGIVGNEFDNKKKASNKKKNKKDEDDDGSNKRYTVSLLTILQTFHAPKVIDFLSLDVEGAETYIMKGFPFDEYKFLCLTIERPKDELKELLSKNGYKHVLDFKRGDTLWAHESVYEEGKQLAITNRHEIDNHKVKSPIPGYS